MERRAIEARGIAANLRRDTFELGAAGRQEDEMAGILHDVVFGLGWQSVIHMLGMPRMRKHFVTVATPKLDRDRDSGKCLGRESIGYSR